MIVIVASPHLHKQCRHSRRSAPRLPLLCHRPVRCRAPARCRCCIAASATTATATAAFAGAAFAAAVDAAPAAASAAGAAAAAAAPAAAAVAAGAAIAIGRVHEPHQPPQVGTLLHHIHDICLCHLHIAQTQNYINNTKRRAPALCTNMPCATSTHS